MKLDTLLIGASVAALSLAALPSQAAVYLWNYTATSGNITSGSGAFTTSDTLNGAGGYDVLSITGTVDGWTISGLVNNPNQPGVSTSPLGLFNIDNNYFAGPQAFSNWGLLFTSGTDEFNLWADNATTYQLWRGAPGQGWTNSSVGTLTVGTAGIPEPATWALMIGGFAMCGAMLRRRRAVLA